MFVPLLNFPNNSKTEDKLTDWLKSKNPNFNRDNFSLWEQNIFHVKEIL